MYFDGDIDYLFFLAFLLSYDILIIGGFMKENYFHFKKKFGQNFLKDQTIPRKIVEAANIQNDSLVIEIGPGAGALTKELSKVAKQVICYEIDTSLEDILDRELLGLDNVRVIYDDFLKRDVKQDLCSYEYHYLYVVANLPYYIMTPIITRLIESDLGVDKVVVMIQKEVADRFCAKPGTREYGSITVFLNYYFDLKKEFLVSRNCFVPKPNVDSVVISLNKKKEQLSVNNKELFFQLVKDSFRFKRKTIRNNLKGYCLEKIEAVLNEYHLDLNVRAEDLSLEIFGRISNNLG